MVALIGAAFWSQSGARRRAARNPACAGEAPSSVAGRHVIQGDNSCAWSVHCARGHESISPACHRFHQSRYLPYAVG